MSHSVSSSQRKPAVKEFWLISQVRVMTYSTAEILLLHLLNLVKLRPLLKDSVWALHKRAREESLPVLQVAQHVVHVDDSVPDFAFICLPLLFPFNVDLKVVEVHASAHFLNVVH